MNKKEMVKEKKTKIIIGIATTVLVILAVYGSYIILK